MRKNLGSIDRVIRVLLAVVFAVLFFTKIVTGTLGVILLVLGVVFLLTSIVSFCPVYFSLGLSSKGKEESK